MPGHSHPAAAAAAAAALTQFAVLWLHIQWKRLTY
jgi:hypothetical protein